MRTAATEMFDIEFPIFAFSHCRDVVAAVTTKDVVAVLGSIALPKSILTNSPLEHAQRILAYLEIGHLFERIFDIRTNAFRGKPEKELYLRVLAVLDRKAPEVLFIDDRIDYLLAFREIGGNILWMANGKAETGSTDGVPRIARIKELPEFLNRF